MNTLNEVQLNEITGGITPVTVTIAMAIATYIAANWTSIKQGVADGFLDGYTAMQ